MTTKTAKLLDALGHIEIPNTRCLAVEGEPVNPPPGRPICPPRFCGLKAGHDGPHKHFYGTQRIHLRPDLITELPGLPSRCSKCNTVWPCEDAKTIIGILGEKQNNGDDGNEVW